MSASDRPAGNGGESARSHPLLLVGFWLYVLVPLAWGVASTIQKAMALFGP